VVLDDVERLRGERFHGEHLRRLRRLVTERRTEGGGEPRHAGHDAILVRYVVLRAGDDVAGYGLNRLERELVSVAAAPDRASHHHAEALAHGDLPGRGLVEGTLHRRQPQV